jgi:hypothetical protein
MLTAGFTESVMPSGNVVPPIVMPPFGTIRGKPTLQALESFNDQRPSGLTWDGRQDTQCFFYGSFQSPQ